MASRGAVTGVGAVALTLVMAGCGLGAPSQASGPDRIEIIATAASIEAQPTLTSTTEQLVRSGIESDRGVLHLKVEGTNGPNDVLTLDLVARRGHEVEHSADRRRNLADQKLAELRGALERAAGSSGTVDTLGTLAHISRMPASTTAVVVTSGLQTDGPLSIEQLGWDHVGSPEMLDEAQRRGLIPDLAGKSVIFSGLGDVAGPQAELPDQLRRRLAEMWRGLCLRGGASRCDVDQQPLTGAPVSTVPVPLVTVPAQPPLNLPTAFESRLELSADVLFEPDGVALVPEAVNVIKALSTRIPHGAHVSLTGHTASVGPADSARALSLRRAEAVRDALVTAGVSGAAITATGVGYDDPIVPDRDQAGQLIPRAAQQNRTVIVNVSTDGGSR